MADREADGGVVRCRGPSGRGRGGGRGRWWSCRPSCASPATVAEGRRRSWPRQGQAGAGPARHDGGDDRAAGPRRLPAGPPRADLAARRRAAGQRAPAHAGPAPRGGRHARRRQRRLPRPARAGPRRAPVGRGAGGARRRHADDRGRAPPPVPPRRHQHGRGDVPGGRRRSCARWRRRSSPCSNACIRPRPSCSARSATCWPGTTRGRRWSAPLGVLDDPRRRTWPATCSAIHAPATRFPAWRVAADEQVGRLRRAMTRWERRRDGRPSWSPSCAREPEFELRWAAHPVDEKRRGAKQIAHPTAGDLDLAGRGARHRRRQRAGRS